MRKALHLLCLVAMTSAMHAQTPERVVPSVASSSDTLWYHLNSTSNGNEAYVVAPNFSMQALPLLNPFTGDTVTRYQQYPYDTAYVWQGHTKPSGQVVIPATIQYHDTTWNVTSISRTSFWGCNEVTRVVLPESIRGIWEAFESCAQLQEVNLPDSTNLYDDAFRNCPALTTLQYNPALNRHADMQYGSIVNCPALQQPVIFGNAFVYIGSHSGPYAIPQGITCIHPMAFYGCTGLTSVSIPSSVDTLGTRLFQGCRNLETFDYNATHAVVAWPQFWSEGEVTSGGYDDFYAVFDTSNISLRTFNIGENVESVPLLTDAARHMTTNFNANNYTADTLYLLSPGGNLNIGRNVHKMPRIAFYAMDTIKMNAYNLTTSALLYCQHLVIGSSVQAIPDGMFSAGSRTVYNNHLLTIDASQADSLTTIGQSMFKNCRNLTSVVLSNSIHTIGYDAFYGCASLQTATLGNGINTIGAMAFYGCSSLTSISIPNATTQIGESAFHGCTSMTTATLGNGVASIGQKAFEGCSALTSISIPNTTTQLGNEVFSGCTALNSASIGNGVTYLPSRLFYNCNHLTSISLGSGVQNISPSAFEGCTAVLRLSCQADVPPSATSNPFGGFNTGIAVSVPCASVGSYQSAPYWGFFTNYQGQTHAFSAVSDNLQMGSVQIITAPDCQNLQAEVQANPYNGYRFVGWNDGETEAHRYLVLTQDTALVAYFEPSTQGVDKIETDNLRVTVSEGRILVEGIEDSDLRVFDITGRMVPNRDLPTGVYMVRTGSLPARKVVVIN